MRALYEREKNLNKFKNTISEISNFAKKIDVMADIVINHSSARGLWFRNFLREKGSTS